MYIELHDWFYGAQNLFKTKILDILNLIYCRIGKVFSHVLSLRQDKALINHFKNYLSSFRAGGVFVILVMIALIIPKHTVRYAIFAGYNADKTVHPYVITYLKGLNEVTDGVIYITDSELLPEEEEKLKGLVIHAEHNPHGEYDWGSYKRGFNWLKKNGYFQKADEVIFANDSCYAPMSSFQPMFEEMAKRKNLDFWGDSQNSMFTPHLQSYFLVFRKRVLNSKNFAIFMNYIKHYDDHREYILQYETQLTQYLEHLGYKWDSYIPYKQLAHFEYTDKNSYPLTLIRDYHHQFLKRRTFTTLLDI
jgi:lipopolysaccharide biosynthesis protein